MLETNWNWRNNRIFCHVFVIGEITITRGACLPSLAYAYAPNEENKKGVRKFSARFLAFSNKISKNSAVLEPRTGQFSSTWGFEAKAKDFKMCPRGLHLCSTLSLFDQTGNLIRAYHFSSKHFILSTSAREKYLTSEWPCHSDFKNLLMKLISRTANMTMSSFNVARMLSKRSTSSRYGSTYYVKNPIPTRKNDSLIFPVAVKSACFRNVSIKNVFCFLQAQDCCLHML